VGGYFLNSHVNSCDRTLYGTDGGAFYASNAQIATLAGPIGKDLLQDSLRGLFVYTCTDPSTESEAGFGQANWHLTDKATLTLGARATHESKDNDYHKYLAANSQLLTNIAAGAYTGATAAQLTAAQAIRTAQSNQLGIVNGEAINATSYAWLINPSFKITDDVLLYASASHGEKSGAVLFNTTALTTQNVAPEKALDFELGVKAVLLNHRFTVNVNLYDTEVTDYQQNITVPDATQTSGFRTYLGNAPKVRLSGLELDTSYTLNEYFSLTWTGAYNRAIYADFEDAPCPADISSQVNSAGVVVGPFQCNLTGHQLPYAPKFTTNIGPEFNAPISHGYQLHANVNAVFRSRANYAAGLSNYGWQGAYTILDAGIGITSANEKWSYDFVGSNLLDKQYAQDITTFSSTAAVTAYPGERRYYGLRVHVKL
jgi:iron complex outermembrane receptor protein